MSTLVRPTTSTETIAYTTAPTSMGLALVAVSSKGVCAVLLGSDARSLVADLRRRFPAAEAMHQEIASVLCARHVIAVIESPETPLDVPLDLRGSEVQRSIWHAVRDIPAGSTASYKEIAKKIGVPTTAQDVSDACAANALAIVVPCHRVIRSDGSLSGYRWGIKRKQALLDKERQVARDAHEVRHHTASSPAATAARSSRRQTHWISCSSGRALPHASGERGPSPLGRRQGAVPHRAVTSRARLRRASGASRLMQSRIKMRGRGTSRGVCNRNSTARNGVPGANDKATVLAQVGGSRCRRRPAHIGNRKQGDCLCRKSKRTKPS